MERWLGLLTQVLIVVVLVLLAVALIPLAKG